MKDDENMDKKKILTLCLVSLLIFGAPLIPLVSSEGFISGQSDGNEVEIDQKSELKKSDKKEFKKNYLSDIKDSQTSHPPISIYGNTDLADTAQSEGWPGDGSENNPYIIEGYSIDGNGSECMNVQDTTDYFVIKDCTFFNGSEGIKFNNLTHGVIKNNMINSTDIGIYIGRDNSQNKIIDNTLFSNEEYGIRIEGPSKNNTISRNFIYNNKKYAVYIKKSNFVNISDNTIKENDNGINIIESSNLTILNNSLHSNDGDAIVIFKDGHFKDGHVNIIDNSLVNNQDGIRVEESSKVNVQNNSANSNNNCGIMVTNSQEISITNNSLTENEDTGLHVIRCYKIYIADNLGSYNNISSINLYESRKATLFNNKMWGPGLSLGIIEENTNIKNWNTHNIDTSNTVNDKPVYYWKNRTGDIIPEDAGQVILGNCSEIKVENLNFDEKTTGIQLGFSDNNYIANNTISSSTMKGLFLIESHDNMFINNSVKYTSSPLDRGLYGAGFSIFLSDGNKMIENNISSNDLAILMGYSEKNQIYHNNFINNTEEVNGIGNNIWNDTYPTGGNYWSNYSGTDQYNGPDQDQPGSDGIGDSNYTLYENNVDEYPLMEPWGSREQIPPNAPGDPSPEDGDTNVSTFTTLSVSVSDPDEDSMDITFYNAFDDSVIKTKSDVASGSRATVNWSGLEPNTEYNWYAVANDSHSQTKSPEWSFKTSDNYIPYQPSEPNPSDEATEVSTAPIISVKVSDPDGDSMDVTFYNASDDSEIGTDNNVADGDRASVIWSELSKDTEYSWYAVANDGYYGTESAVWSFTTIKPKNNPPEAPMNPIPDDGVSQVGTSPTLTVDVSDPDDDSMDVTFYDADDDSEIGTDNNVATGDSASVSWSGLSFSTTYEWYAVANDSISESSSSIWSFTTGDIENNPPDEPMNPSPTNGATGISISPTLSVEVSDPDGDSLDVTFYDADDDSVIGSETSVSSGNTASVKWSGLSTSTSYGWYAIASDSDLNNQSSTWSFTTGSVENNPPNKPTNPTPNEGATDINTDPTLSVEVSDPEGDTMDVTFYDASDDTIIGRDTSISSGEVASITWNGLSKITTYEWYAIADDSELENKSSLWSFTTKNEENNPPYSPRNPSPSDEAKNINIPATISVDVSDPDDDNMKVMFYDASDDTIIDSKNSIESGDTVSVEWSGLSKDTTYDWYAISYDGSADTRSSTWSFTTKVMNDPPNEPTDPSIPDGDTDVNTDPTLSIVVTDPDSETLDVTFYDADDDSEIDEVTGVESGGTASIDWSGLSEDSSYEWYVVVSDGKNETTSSTFSFKTEEGDDSSEDVGNTWFYAGIGAVVILILIAVIVLLNKRKKNSETFEPEGRNDDDMYSHGESWRITETNEESDWMSDHNNAYDEPETSTENDDQFEDQINPPENSEMYSNTDENEY